MPDNPQADRNLLFGILALQLDFISRDQLVAAMHAWVLEKHKALGDILCAQGALAHDNQVLLEALVQKHLRQHHDDPQASLAAVSPLPLVESEREQLSGAKAQVSWEGRVRSAIRQLLLQLDDPDVQASLAHVTTDREPEADAYPTRSYSVGMPTSAGLRFRILRPHAKGGLGEVFVAHDEELHREVALKEIQERHADDANSRARFLLEAEITGGLEHPGIVPVYGLGTYADGRPFYAMRFIKGDSLKDAITRFHASDPSGGRKPPESDSGGLRPPLGERTLAFRKLLGRFVDVCNALAYAHSRGVLHRDLKPGNVMLGQYGETLVVDWGLAKALGRTETTSTSAEGELRPASASGSAATQMGSALGTPAYMAPEQAAGRLDQLGSATDVYGLGATLYCLLTGKAPFQDREAGEVLRKVQKGDFPPPRQINGSVQPALEAVCLKAMALRPADRYPSAKALADNIEHWLADEPVSAWPEPWTVRARRWSGRHRTLLTGAAAALLVAAISLAAATLLLTAKNDELTQAYASVEQHAAHEVALRHDADKARDNANQQKTRAEIQKTIADQERDNAKQQKAEAEKQKANAEQRRREAVVNEQKALAAARAEKNAKDAEAAQRQQAEAATDLLASVFRHLDPRAEQKGLSFKDQMKAELDAAASRLDKEYARQPLIRARLRQALGEAQLGLGNAATAAGLFEKALADRKKHLPPDHADIEFTMNYLALAYQAAGRLTEALPLFEEVLDKQQDRQGADHFNTLLIINNLANAYRDAGQPDRALRLLKATLAKMKGKFGPDHPLTLLSMNNLAIAYQDAGQTKKALPLFEEALAKRIETQGPDHPDTLLSKDNLAGAYQHAGRWTEALPLVEEVLEKRKEKLGPDHPDTLTSMNNLAFAYKHSGQLDKALRLYRAVVARSKAKLGAYHPLTLRAMNNLATAYRDAGQLDKALPLIEETLAKQKLKLGPDHPDTLTTMNNLAELYQDTKQLAKALPLLEQVSAKLKDRLGPDHPDTLLSMGNLADAYDEAGQLTRALPLYEDTLARMQAKLGSDHLHTLTTAAKLARTYLEAKEPKKALPLFRAVLAAQKKRLGRDNPGLAYFEAYIATDLLKYSQPAAAEPILRECLTICQKKLPDHWHTFSAQALLGVALLGQKKYQEAEPLLLKGYEGMKQREAQMPPSARRILTGTLQKLVQLYEATGQAKQAARWQKELQAAQRRAKE
jgi:serine/threonine protein kinase